MAGIERSGKEGFSLLEVLISLVILAVGLLALAMFQVTAAHRTDKMSIRVDQHLAAHVPRCGAFAFDHRAQRGRAISFFKFNKRLIN